ncbi:single-stranded-DNA-specific exonuclease RecJ [Patescibacteria group bacterium]|nr:single-stranded-DNA-specific exonuclease RecJ [Patescibacteria group bacterium]
MDNKKVKWEVIFNKKSKDLNSKKIVEILLKNRGIKTSDQKKEFLNPVSPKKLTLDRLGISKKDIKKSLERLKTALKNKEKIIIYGDYDADGITGTAVLWETLFDLGFDVWPHIPERFSEGYGVNFESVKILKDKFPNLGVLITVDNGIVAGKEIEKIKKIGIDVIVTDHHKKGKTTLKSFSIVHTTKISGSGVAWIFSREIQKYFTKKIDLDKRLDLVAIGTIADQVPLTGANRSFVKWGLQKLNETKRPGLISLFKEAGLKEGEIGTYEVGYIIAPRINAMGRIEHGIDSLRILCTKSIKRSVKLAKILRNVNIKRQKIVDEVVIHARKMISKTDSSKVLILAHESYHEGVIGLAASRLVEQFYKPAIVIFKGKKISKASARSISGFNIIDAIKKLDHLLQDGGGHPMAAGFSLFTSDIENFKKEFISIAKKSITEEMLAKKIKIDMILNFSDFSLELIDDIGKLEPFGIGNPHPIFFTEDVEILELKTVGKENKHLKLVLKKNDKVIDAIAFYLGDLYPKFSKDKKIKVVYSLEKNLWDGREKIQMKIRAIK